MRTRATASFNINRPAVAGYRIWHSISSDIGTGWHRDSAASPLVDRDVKVIGRPLGSLMSERQSTYRGRSPEMGTVERAC